MRNLTRTLIATTVALPLALGAAPAFAGEPHHEESSGFGDRFRVAADVDSSDDLLEDTVVDLRVISTDDDERFGVRSQTDTGEVDDLHTDTRAVAQDGDDAGGTEAVAGRAILDLNEVEDLQSDVDVVTIDGGGESDSDNVMGAEEGEAHSDETQVDNDAEYVFGQ